MSAIRKTREAEGNHISRDEEEHEEVWLPPSVLEAPPPREGFRQRWVSTQILGTEVPHHTMKRFREGWQPRSPETVPPDFQIPTIEHAQYGGCVGVEGMILCEMPESRAKARDQYFAGRKLNQNKFVSAGLDKVERSGGVPIQRSHKSTVSRGRSEVADDI